MSILNLELRASTLVEVLVAMTLSGLVLLAAYDGLNILCSGIKRFNAADCYEHLDRLEHYEILEFRSDSVIADGDISIFYLNGKPVDTLKIRF